MTATPLELYYAGRLQEAVAAATQEVRQRPTETASRWLLCDLLCFAGDLERADKQLEAIASVDTSALVPVALTRHLLRAEQARQAFYTQGAVPAFLDGPTPRLKLHLEASICLREGKAAEAAGLLAQAEEQRPRLRGTCDGQPFDDLRDLDDLTASFFEVLASSGQYYWIPMERVERVEFRPHQRLRDLLWRGARLVVRDGPDGDVYLPVVYGGSLAEDDVRLRLGQMTDWRGGAGAPVRGVGQRMFLVGDQDRPFMEFKQLTIEAPPS